MYSRGDDVRRVLTAQLHDVLAQVGFNHAQARRFQDLVQPDLLGDHALGFGDQLRPILAGNLQNSVRRLRPISGSQHGHTIHLGALNEFR